MRTRFLGLLSFVWLAACVSPSASMSSASLSIAEDVAVSVQDLAEAQARYGDSHPQVVRLKATQESLMKSGAAASSSFDGHLVDTLTHQLAQAQSRKAGLALRYGAAHPEMMKCDAVIHALTEALRDASSRKLL